jgi:hypothetical protein
VDGNPLTPSTRLGDIKGAEMKYKLKGIKRKKEEKRM